MSKVWSAADCGLRTCFCVLFCLGLLNRSPIADIGYLLPKTQDNAVQWFLLFVIADDGPASLYLPSTARERFKRPALLLADNRSQHRKSQCGLDLGEQPRHLFSLLLIKDDSGKDRHIPVIKEC